MYSNPDRGPPGNLRNIPNVGLVPKNRIQQTMESRKDQRGNVADQTRVKTGYYDPLMSIDESDPVDSKGTTSNVNIAAKSPKPPPIMLPRAKLSEVAKHINNVADKKNPVQFKLTDDDVRILCQCEEDFKLITKHLINNQIEFCTHPLRGEKKLKICLYGLNEVNEDALISALKEKNLNVTSVKMIKPKDGYRGEARIYILYFNKTDKIKISDLRSNITGLFNLCVKFQYYSPKKFGVTQCIRCQGLGHGAENCYLKPRCVTCAEEHDSKVCKYRKAVPATPENPAPKPKAAADKVKCALCSGNHTASYSGCPVKQKYQIVPNNNNKIGTKRPLNTNDRKQFPPLAPNQPVPTTTNEWGPSINPNFTQPIWEMQMQFMQTLQQMQQEMFQTFKSLIVEVKSMMQTISTTLTQSK